MTSQERDADAPRWDPEAFELAAQRWLAEHGRALAQREIGALALGRGVTAEDVVGETLLSLVATVARQGVPVDPSDAGAVAAYVHVTLKHRVIDLCRAATRRVDEPLWPGDDEHPEPAADADPVEVLLGDWLFDCVRRALSRRRREALRDGLFADVALAALTYLQVGPPRDAPAPQTKATSWTRAGWAALESVDREQFFPPPDDVAPNTATRRRLTALDRARQLLQTAAADCMAQAR